ncbi:IreB family regulatory phosphoprotein [Vallitalea okinawensis]|uniref:IreB family regulatory phosphoprotein n=1 Tax=Vallitalea okinawensis TaxID=2078660 RepID=UPI000CFB27A6|nr:IreB family regulatory phosphoprotein [Vallitalea okinawensis]
MDKYNTQYFKVANEEEREVSQIISDVYSALVEKGYNPVNQIVGYILSGDPTYITSHNNARTMISKLERDEILEELVRNFVESNSLK